MRRRKFSKFSKSDFLEENIINLTPLIDVVFVVLIAFIVIAPLIEIDKINLAVGKSENLEKKDLLHKNYLNIYVKQDNSIWINNNKIQNRNFQKILLEKKKYFPNQIPKVFHDRKAYFETYQFVKNSLEKAGFREMDIILKSK